MQVQYLGAGGGVVFVQNVRHKTHLRNYLWFVDAEYILVWNPNYIGVNFLMFIELKWGGGDAMYLKTKIQWNIKYVYTSYALVPKNEDNCKSTIHQTGNPASERGGFIDCICVLVLERERERDP